MIDESGTVISRLCETRGHPILRSLNKMVILLNFAVPAQTENLYGESLQAAYTITPNGRL